MRPRPLVALPRIAALTHLPPALLHLVVVMVVVVVVVVMHCHVGIPFKHCQVVLKASEFRHI